MTIEDKKYSKKVSICLNTDDINKIKEFLGVSFIKLKAVKKPKLSKNKFSNLTENDWKEANEQTKKDRGISGLTYRDIFKNREF